MMALHENRSSNIADVWVPFIQFNSRSSVEFSCHLMSDMLICDWWYVRDFTSVSLFQVFLTSLSPHACSTKDEECISAWQSILIKYIQLCNVCIHVFIFSVFTSYLHDRCTTEVFFDRILMEVLALFGHLPHWWKRWRRALQCAREVDLPASSMADCLRHQSNIRRWQSKNYQSAAGLL